MIGAPSKLSVIRAAALARMFFYILGGSRFGFWRSEKPWFFRSSIPSLPSPKCGSRFGRLVQMLNGCDFIFLLLLSLLTTVQQIRVEDRVRRTRKTLKLFLMSHLRSFSTAIESFTLTDGSVEDMLLAVQVTDLDWNVVLRMSKNSFALRKTSSWSFCQTYRTRTEQISQTRRFYRSWWAGSDRSRETISGTGLIHAHGSVEESFQMVWKSAASIFHEREILERTFPSIHKALARYGIPYG